MARSYANILTAIWRPGSDFRNLPADAQRAYLMLVTQSDISAAGTLDLTVRRWADLAEDTKTDDILRALVTLADARYVVVDHDTEELLVRSFVRHDNGYRNSKRRPAILEAARDARSPLLRRALAAEFNRLGLPTGGLTDGPDDPDPRADSPSDGPSSAVDNSSEYWETRNSDVPGPGEAFAQVEGLSDSQCHRTSDSKRVVGTKGEYRELPQPATLTPQPATPPDEPATPEEGADWRTELTAQVRAIRPAWSSRSISRAISDPDVAERPPDLIAAALLAVARDPTSEHPGRLKADGPWWPTAERRTGRGSAAAIDPPCGHCGPNRQIELPDGRPARCPTCHPLRATA